MGAGGQGRTSRLFIERLRRADSAIELWARGEPANLNLATHELRQPRSVWLVVGLLGRRAGEVPLTGAVIADVVLVVFAFVRSYQTCRGVIR